MSGHGCGTPAGYKRHHRRGETPCEPCRQAACTARQESRRRTKTPPPEKPGPDWDTAIKRFRRTLRTVYGNEDR